MGLGQNGCCQKEGQHQRSAGCVDGFNLMVPARLGAPAEWRLFHGTTIKVWIDNHCTFHGAGFSSKRANKAPHC